MRSKGELLKELDRCVLEMEDDLVADIAKEYIDAGYDAYEGIMLGLAKGMEKAGKLYDEEEYFVPELLVCSNAMYNGLDILKKYLVKNDSADSCTVLIGVVEGDTHDIGKNLVKIMIETAGFDVVDLGRDVPVEKYIEEAKRIKKGIICMSTLMTTTMMNMGRVIERLKEEGIRDNFKIMVGGGPISQGFADKIGADSYTTNAAEAAEAVKELSRQLLNVVGK